MKIKTSKLKGLALDWAVGKAIGVDVRIGKEFVVDANNCVYNLSSDWLKCGEFINNYWIDLMFEEVDGVNYCYASPPHLMGDYATANTAQEAICRAVVMLGIGNEVEIPEELINVN
ncbi:hypothetical protein ACTXA3_09610 [Proteus mirabilis]|uniref:hypothetical protein n=1 Tax=Proteus mirabilis TaxID=584 RepID=UPI003FD6E025